MIGRGILEAVMVHVQTLLSCKAGSFAILLSLLVTLFIAARVILCVLNFIYVYFLRPGKNLRKFGRYAIVTGATDGIGLAYAFELAAKGMDLILVSRTQAKLDTVAEQLKAKHSNISVITFAIDLTNLTDKALNELGEEVNALDVGILVNNAGMSLDHPEYLEGTDLKTNKDLIAINAYAPTALAHMVLPGMKRRHRGVIINLGSANGILPAVPLLCTYAGTKAYINQFSRSLDDELKRYNVRVQDQCPFFVTTKISKIRKPRIDAPTPKAWAKAAVKQIGYESSRTPYWSHGLMVLFIDNVLPAAVVKGYVHSLHMSFRTRYYKKQARLAAAEAVESSKKSE